MKGRAVKAALRARGAKAASRVAMNPHARSAGRAMPSAYSGGGMGAAMTRNMANKTIMKPSLERRGQRLASNMFRQARRHPVYTSAGIAGALGVASMVRSTGKPADPQWMNPNASRGMYKY